MEIRHLGEVKSARLRELIDSYNSGEMTVSAEVEETSPDA